jgi:hypothetical protein
MKDKEGNHELKVSEYFGDARVGELNPNLEIVDASSSRQRRVRFLRLGEERHRRLADKLDGCEKGHRCKSEADPVCAALFRQRLYRAVGAILAERPWTRAAVITSGLLMPYGHLCEFDLTRAVERLRKRLELSSLRNRIIIGAIELSLNLRDRKIIGWQLYLDLLVEGKNCRSGEGVYAPLQGQILSQIVVPGKKANRNGKTAAERQRPARTAVIPRQISSGCPALGWQIVGFKIINVLPTHSNARSERFAPRKCWS